MTIEVYSLKDIPTTGKVVIDFYSDMCKPCKVFMPLYENYSNSVRYEYNITFYKVNANQNMDIIKYYGIEVLPTILFINNNKVIYKQEGADLYNFGYNTDNLNAIKEVG